MAYLRISRTLAVFVFLPIFSHGSELSPMQIVNRCYSHLTGERLGLQSPLRKTPPTNIDAALKICDSFVDSAVFNVNTNQVAESTQKPTGIKVLNNLYDFHRSWFGTDTYLGMQGVNGAHIEGTSDNFDSTEPALMITRAMFASELIPQSRYDSIFQGKAGVYALREIDEALNSSRKFPQNTLPSRFSDKTEGAPPSILVKKDSVRFQRNDSTTSLVYPVSNPIQIGTLVGIVNDNRNLAIPNYNPYTERHSANFNSSKLYSQSAKASPDYLVGFNIYENQGGGLLGLNSFIFLNWGLEPGMLQTGSLKMGRRWTEKVFNSLLCRELPVLRVNDVSAYVIKMPNVTEFRKSNTCMSCHATMDPMAAVGRNILISGSDSDYSADLKAKFSHVIGRVKPKYDIGADWPAVDHPDFHLTLPHGQVFYRTSDGILVQRQVASFEDVGSVLKASPDLYKCATIRYLEFLTGIKLDLYDVGDPAHASKVASESSEKVKLRLYIEDLARQFSTHQNLRKLLKDLMRSKYYLDSDNIAAE